MDVRENWTLVILNSHQMYMKVVFQPQQQWMSNILKKVLTKSTSCYLQKRLGVAMIYLWNRVKKYSQYLKAEK